MEYDVYGWTNMKEIETVIEEVVKQEDMNTCFAPMNIHHLLPLFRI